MAMAGGRAGGLRGPAKATGVGSHSLQGGGSTGSGKCSQRQEGAWCRGKGHEWQGRRMFVKGCCTCPADTAATTQGACRLHSDVRFMYANSLLAPNCPAATRTTPAAPFLNLPHHPSLPSPSLNQSYQFYPRTHIYRRAAPSLPCSRRCPQRRGPHAPPPGSTGRTCGAPAHPVQRPGGRQSGLTTRVHTHARSSKGRRGGVHGSPGRGRGGGGDGGSARGREGGRCREGGGGGDGRGWTVRG